MTKQPTNKSLILEFAKQGKEFNGIDAWQYVVARKPRVSKRSVQATLHQLKKNDALHSPGRDRFHIAGGRRGASADSKKITANKRPAKRSSQKKEGSRPKYYAVYKAAFESSGENILETRDLVEAIKTANPGLSNYWQYPKKDAERIKELVIVEDGKFAWIESGGGKAKPQKAQLIDSYGVHWQRDESGVNKNQLLGERQDKRIDKTTAKGIYVLYRGEKIVYVGKSIGKNGIGQRLSDHLRGRSKNRWDTFSFFEVKGENEEQVINTIEAILIELLETPLNRKFEMNSEIEITQVTSEEVLQKRAKISSPQALNLMNKLLTLQ